MMPVPGEMTLPLEEKEIGDVHVAVIRLGFLPPSKNVYDGWKVEWKSALKRKWCKHIAEECDRQQLPRGLRKVGIAARLVFPTNQRRDPQNYSQTLWNFVPDALVKCGMLVDDRAGMVEIGPNFGVEMTVDSRPHLQKKKRQRTVLTIAYKVVEGQCLECMRDEYGRCKEHRLRTEGEW